MRIVFLGSGAFGLPSLQHLAQHHTLLTVVSQPDKPAGRGSQLTPTPIAAWAAQSLAHVPLIQPATVNEPAVRDSLRALDADAWVVIAFGQKLGRALLEGKFAVNLHASLLPRWRGAAPIHAAILAGDAITGNSVITLADKMDAGLVLGQSQRNIAPDATTALHFALKRAERIVKGLVVDADAMQRHLDSAGDVVFSGGVLLALVERGASRHEAYSWVQQAALGGSGMKDRLKKDERITSYVDVAVLDRLFSLENQLQHTDVIFARVLGA